MLSQPKVSYRHDGLTLRRRFRHGPETMFAAFSDPELLACWWGPPACPIVEMSLDFRPGGIWHYCTRSTRTAVRVWSRAVFIDIRPGRRIVFRETSSNVHGDITTDRAPSTVTVELVPIREGTEVVIDVRHLDELELRRAMDRGVVDGLSRALDQLGYLLDREGISNE